MKQASFKDAILIGDALDFDVDAVWELIKGKAYTDRSELEVLVCKIHAELAPGEI